MVAEFKFRNHICSLLCCLLSLTTPSPSLTRRGAEMLWFCFSAKRVFDFSPSDEPSNVAEAGLTARNAVKGRGRTPKPFVTAQG